MKVTDAGTNTGSHSYPTAFPLVIPVLVDFLSEHCENDNIHMEHSVICFPSCIP